MENHNGAREMPCSRVKPGNRNYCKMSDRQINAVKSESDQQDAYVSLAYKAGMKKPRCIAFGKKSCKCRNMDAYMAGSRAPTVYLLAYPLPSTHGWQLVAAFEHLAQPPACILKRAL